MLRSRTRHGIVCFAASVPMILQGCYYYAPAQLPLPSGGEIRVEGPAIELHEGATVGPIGTSCRVRQVTGMLASTRGDTVTLQPLLGVRRVSPSGSCTPMSKATLVVVPQSTRVSVPRFSGSKTALSVIGGAVLIGGLGFFYMLSTDKTADGRPGPATPR